MLWKHIRKIIDTNKRAVNPLFFLFVKYKHSFILYREDNKEDLYEKEQ